MKTYMKTHFALSLIASALALTACQAKDAPIISDSGEAPKGTALSDAAPKGAAMVAAADPRAVNSLKDTHFLTEGCGWSCLAIT